MEELQVSFSWIYPKIKSNGKCNAYCFAYIRDPKTYSVLYSGVKFTGLFSDLKHYKSSLRKTAVERLYKKPIYAVFSVGNDENYKKNLSDPKFKFNGIGFDKKIKKSNALGKFFVYCALNQTYSNLGICASKTSADLKFNVIGEKYEIPKNVNKDTIYLKYGYEFKGDEIKRIILSSNLVETIFNLRKRARFYGKGKDRRTFDSYPTIEKEYLNQFGIYQFVNKEAQIKIGNYIYEKPLVFYRFKISNNLIANIALMDINYWTDFVQKVYKKNINITVSGNLFHTYCLGFYISHPPENNYQKKLYRKVAVDRLIDRPTILDCNFNDNITIKEIREWFADRIHTFSVEGIGRINYHAPELSLGTYYDYTDNSDQLYRFYYNKGNDPDESFTINDLFDFLKYPVVSLYKFVRSRL